jgi:SAM-dependent methyltransferase
MRVLGLRRGEKVLDIGSGGGQLILSIADLDVQAMGVDPFIEETTVFHNGGKILKASLEQVTGIWDLLMFNHSLEHMYDPGAALREANRLSRRGSRLLIRTPVTGKVAWREYGIHWFQLDAPRHVVIFSERGLQRITEENGFRLFEVIYDSTASQFWASEQYRRGISLFHEKSYAVNPKKSSFSRQEIEKYGKRAATLNALHDGDQACFFFERI